MLTTHWSPSTFLPARASPLSPRSANACPRPDLFGRHHAMTDNTAPKTFDLDAIKTDSENWGRGETPSPRHSVTNLRSGSPSAQQQGQARPFSQRDVKANPLMQRVRRTADDQRERRREMFMKKVERGRDEKRWMGRSDQILRSDYLAQHRRWEQERVRESLKLDAMTNDAEQDMDYYDAEYYAPPTPLLPAQLDDGLEVDTIEQMEEAELRALLALQDQGQVHQDHNDPALQHDEQNEMIEGFPNQDGRDSPSTRYGSDDEYDDIFMEYISSQSVPHRQQGTGLGLGIASPHDTDAEMMDMI